LGDRRVNADNAAKCCALTGSIALANLSQPLVRQLNLTTSNVPESVWTILRTNRTNLHVHVFARRNDAVTSRGTSNSEPLVVGPFTLNTKEWLYGVVRFDFVSGGAVDVAC
jgi:hypothetical protein